MNISTHPARQPLPPNDNKICQWYCCSCGQSYGSIIYKKPPEQVSLVTDIHEYLLQNLKHYSSLVYDEEASDQTRVPRTNNDPYTVPGFESSSSENVDMTLSPSGAENENSVLLKIPTRFNCHRCSHMMCPYCPKVRFKDLTK